jgi:subtilisin family serine protease
VASAKEDLSMPQYFVKFPDPHMRLAAQPMLNADPERFRPFSSENHETVLIADLSDEHRRAAERNGAKIYEDIQFHPTPIPTNPFEFRGTKWAYWETATAHPAALALLQPGAAAPWQTKTLIDVLDHIGAPKAWKKARGKGVTLGIVDTGVSSAMSEFPSAKRSRYSKSFAYAAGPWADLVGHGSMCACIATATTAAGGRYNGVAPDATLLSARTNLLATDIYKLYDWVLARKNSGDIDGPVVMSNSYGLYTCTPPAGLPQDHPYRGILLDAINAGIVVVYAAGNNHADVLCKHDPTKCSPNTIWAVNSMDEVLSVGTVNWDNKMDVGAHGNSSRGPGQWASAHKKPDCVAPTYGEVIWGSGYRVLEWWGTSGACPQVAGLSALLLSADPHHTPAAIGDIIRETCKDINLQKTCAGAGLIDCDAAIGKIKPRRSTRSRSSGRG